MGRSGRAGHRSGFSLVEVILALGVFAFAILALLGVMGPIISQISEDRKLADASQIIDSVNIWLRERSRENYVQQYSEIRSAGSSGLSIYFYLWEASDGNGIVSSWKLGDSSSLSADMNAVGSSQALPRFSSNIYRLNLSEAEALWPYWESGPGGTNQVIDFIPVKVVSRSIPPPEPGLSLSEYLQRYDSVYDDLVFNAMMRR